MDNRTVQTMTAWMEPKENSWDFASKILRHPTKRKGKALPAEKKGNRQVSYLTVL